MHDHISQISNVYLKRTETLFTGMNMKPCLLSEMNDRLECYAKTLCIGSELKTLRANLSLMQHGWITLIFGNIIWICGFFPLNAVFFEFACPVCTMLL